MIKRALPIAVVGLVLIGLLLYSQWRSEPAFVSGILETDEIRVGSRVGGRVKRVLVQEGAEVSEGDPLIELDPYDLLEREKQAIAEIAQRQAELNKLVAGLRSEEVAQAKARYEQAQANLKLLLAGPRPQEIALAKSRLKAANAQLEVAEREYNRITELYEKKAASPSEWERTGEQRIAAIANVEVRTNEVEILELGTREEELEQARAQVEETRQGWELAKAGFREEEIEQAKAAVQAAEASLSVIRQQLQELTIRAPVDGYVDALDLQPGDLVPANGPVLTLLSTDRLWMRAYIPQRLMGVELHQKLRVTVDSFPDEDFTGEVTFISHQAEFTPSNVQTSEDRAKLVYRVRVQLPNRSGKLRAGMTGNVWLPNGEKSR